MTETTNYQHAVKVVRATDIDATLNAPGGNGRATVFDFNGVGSDKTWIGRVTMPPGAKTGGHHHGRHEVALYVVKGRVEISWGDKLEYKADLEPGDFAYFTPGVPHQEHNQGTENVDFVVVRSDNERIVVNLG